MRLLILILLLTASCRFPKYTVRDLKRNETAIKEAADYILQHNIRQAAVDTLKDPILLEKLRPLQVDQFEIILGNEHKFKKPNEPLDSILIFTRIRKSTVLMWGGEDIIYDFSRKKSVYPDYFEDDGYQFRRTGERIYYRRYYFRAT